LTQTDADAIKESGDRILGCWTSWKPCTTISWTSNR